MPMYKKSLCILLLIAFIAGGGIFCNYISDGSVALEETPDNIADTAENISADDKITVYVSGEVTSPGVVTLGKDSRIKDAVAACGDFTPLADKGRINLAQKLTDGMQVNVPALTQNSQPTADNRAANAPSASKDGSNAAMVNINTATKDELDTLPGVGPATAEKIIEYRETNGYFKSIEDIKNVRGIGEAKFSKMQSRIQI